VSVVDGELFPDSSEGVLGGIISLLALCDESGDISEWLELGVGFGREVKRDIGKLESLGFDEVPRLGVVG
jgi:hypothetical protein